MGDIEVLGICASPVKSGNVEVFLAAALKAAAETGNVNTRLLTLAGRQIGDCLHCNWCVRKQEELRPCVQKDGLAEIYPEVIKADALLLATPVYMGRLSGLAACFLDRLRGFTYGRLYRGTLRNKVGGALAVAWRRNRGPEVAVLSIASAFLGQEMILAGPGPNLGSAYGAIGMSSEDGTGKFDPKDKLGVLHDECGLQGAVALGRRTAELAKMVKGFRASEPADYPRIPSL